jgi:uncharacterized Zn-binding protein involved in type VI secretion
MKRYTITLGATTTVGGNVMAASSNGSINGAKIALEGDLVFCPICESQGKIKCIEPRIPELWNGKKVALENDLCVCGCPTPPRLIPNQTLRCQNLSGYSEGGIGEFSPKTSTTVESTITWFDEKFILVAEDTGAPLSNVEYAIRRENGNFEYGITDVKGHTHLLAASMKTESIDIYS